MNIYEIARRAGVSIATVSRVINHNPNVSQKTRDRVEKVLEELQYTPNAIARSLAMNFTRTIGVLTSDIRDSYYASAIYTIEQEFKDLGYNVVLCNTGRQLEEKKKYLRILLEKKVDGIILVGSVFKEKSGNRHIIDTAEKVPVIMLNSSLEAKNIYSIVCDDSYAASTVVAELHKRSHEKIVYFYDADSFSGQAKVGGFKEGMMKEGLPLHPYSVLRVSSGFSGGQQGVEELIAMGVSFTAIMTSEDIIAAGVLKSLRVHGMRVPNDVAVFGFNDSFIALCTVPELSSVDNKVQAMGTGAVRILKDVLDGKEVSIKTIIKPELVIRESC